MANAPIPAVCDTCGTVFASPFELEPGTTNAAVFGFTVEGCPTCGGSGPIVDGIYDFVGGTINVVSTWSQDRIERLIAKLSAAREQPNGRAAAEAALTAEPELAGFAKRYLIPRDPNQFWTFVAALLALLALLKAGGGDRTIINNETVIEKIIVQPSAEPPKNRPPPPRKAREVKKKQRGR